MLVLNVVGAGVVFGTGVVLAQSNGQIDSCTTVTESGTYELTEDIENSEQKHCIEIEASNVVLYGNGHLVDGVGEDNTVGVYVPDANGTVEIHDLEVTNWDEGVHADDIDGELRIEDLIAHHNKDGVKAFALDFHISDSELYQNSDDGIHASADSSSIHDNTVYANEEDGMYLPGLADGNVSSNVVRHNDDDGIDGHGTREINYSDNRITGNGDDGLYLRHINQTDVRVNVEANTIKHNADDGVHLDDVERVSIRENTICHNEDTAIQVADTPGSEITREANALLYC